MVRRRPASDPAPPDLEALRPPAAWRELPPALATALHRAQAAELTAVGEQRRPAFRLTRALLGGARRAGYPAVQLAECLGVSTSSIQARGGSDGWITAQTITAVTDLSPRTIADWHSIGLLPTSTIDATGQLAYAASELIRALTTSSPTVTHGSEAS